MMRRPVLAVMKRLISMKVRTLINLQTAINHLVPVISKIILDLSLQGVYLRP